MQVTAIGPSSPPSGAKTATVDSRAQMRTITASASHSPSYIPLFSPKTARKPSVAISSSLPSSLSVPHLGLVAPNRTPSGNGPSSSPQQALPPSSLRTLRSFLPFGGGGSGKSASTAGAGIPGPLKSPFSGFTPVRRTSITVERKNSGQFTRTADDIDVAVISISPPSQDSPERTSRDITQTRSADAQERPLPSLPPLDGQVGPPVVTFQPEPPLSTELSTILESDLSGLSKHLPSLDEFRTSDVSGSGHSTKPEALPPSPEIDELVAPDASVLDLSTSQLKEEVMHALKEKTSTNGWLAGVVVEDAADSRPPSRNDREGLQVDVGEEPEDFHLDALDPDLVALLSANRIRGKHPIFQNENPFASTQTPTVPPRILSPPSRAVTPQSRPSPLGHSPVEASPSSATGSARSQSSPVRSAAPRSHGSLGRAASNRFMPRLMRSVTDRAVAVRGDRSVANTARVPSDPGLPLDDARRISSDSAHPRRPPVPPLHLPLEFQPPPPPPPIQHANTEPHRRVAPSRLATPARFGMNGSATSRLLRSALPSSSALPGAWGTDSPSPTSRASSALGSAADRLERPIRPRTSEDGTLEGRPSARDRLGYTPLNRNRSLSVGGGNSERGGPRSTDGLGPRTAKAFAAAGLLDRDANNSGSRFGSVRSLGGDRDQRALAPSRIAPSEAGSAASSWRSGSVSRAMTHSEANGHDSASTSTGAPRTTRSAESTAPTSISLSRPQSRTPSPQHKNYLAAMQAMVEKHATETGTLLAALADAQHNAQSLRAENCRLKERIEDLEAELVDASAQMRAHQYAASATAVLMAPPSSPHLKPSLARSVFGRMERQAPAEAAAMTRRRPMVGIPISGQHPQMSGSRVVDLDLERIMRDADEENATYQGALVPPAPASASRRASGGAESVFAVPPPNMSLLLQEQPERAGSRRSRGSSVSMTTVSARTDAPGSPRSLFLRPEHELHLGDLGSLDMRFTEDEGDDADAGDDDELDLAL
ncbi:hypothetical protein BC827DRAFT_1241306 [Russula dissimulans]|nr:hypothetical protein BC827DRAFT_1241306 [Russula dissimulans]